MKRLSYFEVDLPICGNTYGVAPCTATGTGDDKCYNTRATCDDLANFRLSVPEVNSVTETFSSAADTNHEVELPRPIEAGDLLLILLAVDGTATATPSDFTPVKLLDTSPSSELRAQVYARTCLGTEDTNMVSYGLSLLQAPFGDLTAAGGLAAAFDGGTSETAATCAQKASTADAYIGQPFLAPKAINSCTVYGSNDNGFVSGINPTVTIQIRGKNDTQPTSATDGTLLGTVSFTDTANESAGRAVTMSDQSTQYDYWVVRVTHNGASNSVNVAEIVIRESRPALTVNLSASEQIAAQVYHVLANKWKGSIEGIELASVTHGGGDSISDPPRLEPEWGEATNLWIAATFTSGHEGVLEFPSGFGSGLDTATNEGATAADAGVASGYIVAKSAYLDPQEFTFNDPSPSAAVTIAVQPFKETTLRFSKAAMYSPKHIDAYPNIVDIQHTPQVISLGENLGERGSVKVTFEDSPHSDTGPGYDPYLEDRSYDPYTQGTHWGKFRARHAFLQGSPCRMIRGLEGEALASMSSHDFIIDGSAGPSTDFKFEITGKDILKLLDGDKAQAPVLNVATAGEDLSAAETVISMSPPGIGDAEFDLSGYVCIGGKEVCSYTRVAESDELTATRGQLGTTGITHDSGVRLQKVLAFEGEDAADILYTLLVTYGGVPPQLITLSAWRAETSAFLNRQYTAYITEPTSVNKLCSEIIEQAALALWQSDNPFQINLQVLRAVASSASVIDENVIVSNTLEIEELTEKRLSQVWTFYAPRDKTRPLTEESNYASVLATIDSDAEADYAASGIKKIYSRWIPTGGETTAERANELLLLQYRRAPRRFTFGLFPDNSLNLTLGNGYRISVPQIQDQNGLQTLVPVILTSFKSAPDVLTCTADELQLGGATSDDVGDLDGNIIQLNSDDFNVDLLTIHNQLYTDAVSGDNVYCFISQGVTIGSVNTSSPALTISGFDTGVNIYLICEGRIQGKGGAGGEGGKARGGEGNPGDDGGTALYVRDPTNIDLRQGEIWGGGGGGGGGGAGGDPSNPPSCGGGGGGGGAGTNAGLGGDGGTGTAQASPGNDGQAGTSENNGSGGDGGEASQGPDGGDGGDGGDPGSDGSSGTKGSGLDGGEGDDGGGSGTATDGDSFLTYGTWSGTAFTPGATGTEDIRGPEVN